MLRFTFLVDNKPHPITATALWADDALHLIRSTSPGATIQVIARPIRRA